MSDNARIYSGEIDPPESRRGLAGVALDLVDVLVMRRRVLEIEAGRVQELAVNAPRRLGQHLATRQRCDRLLGTPHVLGRHFPSGIDAPEAEYRDLVIVQWRGLEKAARF